MAFFTIILGLFAQFTYSVTTPEDCAKKTNCLSCLEIPDCYFCFSFESGTADDTPKCQFVNSTAKCQDRVNKRNKVCVEELGGDAKDSVRYAIGFSILAASILIDLAVRFCSRKAPKDEYSHL